MRINNRGSILILCFWTMIFLSLLAFGITRRVNAEMSLVKYRVDKVRAKYAAMAGLFYAMDQVRLDLQDDETRSVDTLYDCGTALESGQVSEDVFADQKVGDGVFDVMRGETDEAGFGLEDESGKLNINGISEANHAIFQRLLIELGVDEETAEMISCSIVDWKDANDEVFQEGLGAEQKYYEQLNPPYSCKNTYFEDVAELRYIRGMTPEIFELVRPYVTVFPYQGTLQVNFNTAPAPVLHALAMSVIGNRTQTNELDAQSFVERLMEFRQGPDGEWGTADDEPLEFGDMSLFSGPEIAIASTLRAMQLSSANIIRARVRGSYDNSRVKAFVEALITTSGLRVVSLKVR